jgi:epoxide hydrolase-like predicted phosphatase
MTMHKPIQAVIFDYGGVLVRMADESPRQQLAQRYGLRLETIYHLLFDSDSAHLAAQGEITAAKHWQTLATLLKIPPPELPEFIHQFWSADMLDEDLVAYIRRLRRRFKVGLLSNAFDDLRPILQERWKIAEDFDDLVISAEVGLLKPDLRIYHLAVERLGVSPEAAVFLDDVEQNVAGAQAAGLQAILFRDPAAARAELEALLDGTGLPGDKAA